MKRNLVAATVVVSVGAAWLVTAVAQVKPEILVKQRQAAMTLQGKYLGPIGGMLKGTVPYNPEIVARNASYLEVLTKMAWDGFDPSTKNEKNTKAKPEIYSQPEKFKAAYETLQAEVAKLAAAAKARDQDAVKATFGNVAKACNDCHDNFREKQ
jgi:cytochrome c556